MDHFGSGIFQTKSRFFEPGVYIQNWIKLMQFSQPTPTNRASNFQASMRPSGVKQILAIPRPFHPYLILCFFCWGWMTHIQHPEKNGPSPNPFSDFYWPPNIQIDTFGRTLQILPWKVTSHEAEWLSMTTGAQHPIPKAPYGETGCF